MSWYRKYRPKKISDLNLKKVRESFLAMMESGKIPQSLLFAGPKGTGKTSSSRIIGVLLNDKKNAEVVDYCYFGKDTKQKAKQMTLVEPETNNDFAERVYQGQSFVVQEMDAASNRGIDDVRALKERIMLPPQEGKMAVFILDEVHMFTNDAFNALLKILEEPPPHVVFILATTELHKLPATIVSRCTLVNFYKASNDEIIEALKRVVKSEKIDVDDENLRKIADFADGSFRDAVKILEQVCQSGNFSEETLELIIDSSMNQTIIQIITTVLDKKEKDLANHFQKLRQKEVNQSYFYKSFFQFLHHDLLRSLEIETGKAVFSQPIIKYFLAQCLDANLDRYSPIPLLPLEIKLLEIIEKAKNKAVSKNGGSGSGGDKANSGSNNKIQSDKKPQKNQLIADSKNHPLVEKKALEENKLTDINKRELDVVVNAMPSLDRDHHSVDNKILLEKWDDFVRSVNQENSSLGALLRSSQPFETENGKVKIGVYYRFHQEQLESPRFKDVYLSCMKTLFNQHFDLDFILKETPSEIVGLTQPTHEEEDLLLAEHQRNSMSNMTSSENESQTKNQVATQAENQESAKNLSSLATEALM